jgi:hypothetical protein
VGRLGTDPVTDLVTRPVVTECDVGQPGSRAAGPDRVETNAPPDRREGTGLCIQIPVCAVVGVLLVTESPAGVGEQAARARLAGVVRRRCQRLSGGPKFVCCRFGGPRGGWSGRERACSGCGTGPRRRSAPWSQRSHRRSLSFEGGTDRVRAARGHDPVNSKLRRRCRASASARWRPALGTRAGSITNS